MIRDEVRNLAATSAGKVIPKPEAKAPFLIKGMGRRRGEPALIYTILSHTGRRPYEKGITITEFEKAYTQLKRIGAFDRSWFNENLSSCAKDGGCNFTSLGGVFQILGIAEYSERGQYIDRARS